MSVKFYANSNIFSFILQYAGVVKVMAGCDYAPKGDRIILYDCFFDERFNSPSKLQCLKIFCLQ